MCHHSVWIEFPLSSFPDQAIADLYASAQIWFEHVPALATSVGQAAQDEAMRRHHNRTQPEQPPIEAGFFPIHFGFWSDKDVGQAVMWAHAFTTVTGDGRFTELVDELAKVIFHVASMRLIHSTDERNSVDFTDRMQAGQTDINAGYDNN